MTLFYQGSLQEGIAAAVKDTKAVVCFVRDDEELSSTWETAYFDDDEVAQLLNSKAIVLRLTQGSQEAGFLASFCPLSKFPTVVLIKDGTLKEYIDSGVSKDEFRSRLLAALKDEQSVPAQQVQSNITPAAPANPPPAPAPAPVASQIQPETQSHSSKPAQPTEQPSGNSTKKQAPVRNPTRRTIEPVFPAGSSSQSPSSSKEAGNKNTKGKAPMGSKNPLEKSSAKSATPNERQGPKPAASRGPPTQYRLQVRLFDGSSVRSSFTPTQSIRNDVRPWLDQMMEGDNRPYNLKHILTPLPSETLSVAQESQPLRDLGLGSTATLVMVPVSTYTEAYSAAGSLPVRGISAIYNLASSAASTATGLVGSFLGYGAATSEADTTSSSPSPPTGRAQRPRTTGPNIRTLRDQQDGRGDSQFYNGNQLNFEPRKNQDDKDK